MKNGPLSQVSNLEVASLELFFLGVGGQQYLVAIVEEEKEEVYYYSMQLQYSYSLSKDSMARNTRRMWCSQG